MFRLQILFLILIFTLITGCSDDPVSLNPSDLQGKQFAHVLFESEQSCIDYSPDFHINCAQIVAFEDDHKATIMFTDILNEARYFVMGNKVILQATDNAYEFRDSLVFTILPDGDLKLDENETKWKAFEDSYWE